jgi:hypothetical protein
VVIASYCQCWPGSIPASSDTVEIRRQKRQWCLKCCKKKKLYNIKWKENRGEDLKIINYDEDGEEKSRAKKDLILRGPRSSSFWVPRNLSHHMVRQARTGDTQSQYRDGKCGTQTLAWYWWEKG